MRINTNMKNRWWMDENVLDGGEKGTKMPYFVGFDKNGAFKAQFLH